MNRLRGHSKEKGFTPEDDQGEGRVAGWQPIETAPKDGTRVLVRSICFKWSSDICQNIAIGHRAIEASFRAGMMDTEPAWREWCGDENIFSTDWLVAEAWAPLPSHPSLPSSLPEREQA